MIDIVISEFSKLKRYSVLWVGVAVVFSSAILATFQTSMQAGEIPYALFSDNVIWNNFSLAFPFFIVLLGGFLMDREYTDDTLKAMLTVPVSFQRMMLGKLIVTGILTVLFAVFSFVCTALSGALILHCAGMNPAALALSLFQLCAMAFFDFLAVSPLIVWFGKKRGSFFAGVGIAFFYGFCGIFVAGRNLTDFYPITAGLGIIGYVGQAQVHYQPLIGWAVLALMAAVTGGILAFAPSYDALTSVACKKPKKACRRV